MIANWKLNTTQGSEKIDWILEIITLGAVLASLILFGKWNEGDVTLTAAYPIFGSVLIGSGLGIYKKIAMAENRVTPGRFVTAFLFYVTFMLVLLTPYLKYPSLAFQIN